MDPAEIEANISLEHALRRAKLLAAAAKVSQHITQIMDIDELLPKTVDIICETYDFYYAGVFLVDEGGEFAVLKAGRGEPGRIMIENHHKLAVGGNSMIGACTAFNEARISLDVDTERVWYPNPVLPDTRSEMALPLAIGDKVIGAVSVQSVESAAFSEEDISSLQTMANQLGIAIENARQRRELDQAQAELLRTKTFEAIATATGNAIHWIGNKAEPIGSSSQRIRHDLRLLITALTNIVRRAQQADKGLADHPFVQLLEKEAASIQRDNSFLLDDIPTLETLPLDKLERRVSLASILEDLDIIEEAGRLIMAIKEEYIGPAREHAPRPTMIEDVIKDAISELNMPPAVVRLEVTAGVSAVLADPVQLNRVCTNLIKNAYEAMGTQPQPQISVTVCQDRNGDYVRVDVTDNGTGIAEADLEKIWVAFYTTKGSKGHAGLGLSACQLILEQMGGHISVISQPDRGSTFSAGLPIHKIKEPISRGEPGHGKVLVIDDRDTWRRFAVAALESNGFKVTTTDKNYGAGNYHHYDLILIDDILARGDSFEIMQSIKAAGAIAKTIVVSSNPRVERTNARKLLGIRDLLPKPYTRADLLRDVKSALSAIRGKA